MLAVRAEQQAREREEDRRRALIVAAIPDPGECCEDHDEDDGRHGTMPVDGFGMSCSERPDFDESLPEGQLGMPQG